MWTSSVASVPKTWTPSSLRVCGRDEQLEHAVGVADDLAAGQLAVAGDAHLVRHGRRRELVLGLPAVADLGDRVDPDRLERDEAVRRLAARVVGGEPALLHRGRGERGEADDVADGVDVRRPAVRKLLVDRDPAPRCPPRARPRRGRARRWRPAGPRSTSRCRPGSACRCARVVTVPRSFASTLSTVSPNRKVTDRSRRWNFSASTTSVSQKSSIRSRDSTTVTRVPSAANIEAYSMPMTPAPTTTMRARDLLEVRGSRRSRGSGCRRSRPSGGAPGGCRPR